MLNPNKIVFIAQRDAVCEAIVFAFDAARTEANANAALAHAAGPYRAMFVGSAKAAAVCFDFWAPEAFSVI